MKPANHKVIWQGIHFQAIQYQEEVEPGVFKTFEYVSRKDGTRTIAINENDEVLLSYEKRFELEGAYDWRIPGGRLNDEKEPIIDAAKREFKEETGYIAENWIFLWTSTPDSTVKYQRHFFLATKLKFTEASRDPGELIEIHWIPFEKANEMALRGEIREEISALALLRLFFESKNGSRTLR